MTKSYKLKFLKNQRPSCCVEGCDRAADVIVVATHGILSGPATDRLKNAPINEVVLTNTLPIPPEKQIDGMTVLSIAPLIARAIREVFEDGSVTSLFDGRA